MTAKVVYFQCSVFCVHRKMKMLSLLEPTKNTIKVVHNYIPSLQKLYNSSV